jgi:hypothetical protein
VLQFARVYGHIARESMSRKELETLIDSGISPQELTTALFQRIAATPGILLGVNSINPTIEINPTTLLNGVAHAGVFSCARDRHDADAVACPL